MSRQASLTTRAYQMIREDLLTCRLAPGDKLSIKDISAALGVSLGAVREALARLTSEGFVTADSRRGFRATPITVSELVDLVRVRANIEGQCLRRSIEIGGLGWESEVVATNHRLSKTPILPAGSAIRLNDDYAAAHAAFHAALTSACDSPWLLRLRDWLYAQSERYRYLTVPLGRQQRDLVQEHQDLMTAALARDAERATALLEAHLGKTARILLDQAPSSCQQNGPLVRLATH
jgi:DNA-binding GntR family transcriptional regulator